MPGAPSNFASKPHMRFHFETDQWLPYPLELVFAFFANPENLPRLMPRWQKARIEEATFHPPPPRPAGSPRYPGITAGDGTRLTLSFRPFPFAPFRIPWEAEIHDFAWNSGFADTQLRGPFRSWQQQHILTAAPNAETQQPGTTLTDRVDYGLPLPDAMASVANKIVRPQIAATFRYRQKRTLELLPLLASRASA
jgi:ligand-binding SRPBCC domain-containing protein